jgi:toxin-antitoxin system PIN domain toxin
MTPYLLDINVLLALTDPMHVHHDIAHQWFAQTGRHMWATCPLTENGFVRIASHPTYPNRPGNANLVLAMLHQFCDLEGHQFWTDDISLRHLLLADVVFTHQQITDLYLLGLAVHRHGKLATLDHRIPASVIQNGIQALERLHLE